MRPPPCRPIVLVVLPLLLLPAAAPGAPLRDSGYGDGSLVDGRGNYYYPQADGGYVDAYGATFNPLGGGLYGDAIGNLIDAGPDAAPPQPNSRAGRRRGAGGAPASVAPGLLNGSGGGAVERDGAQAPTHPGLDHGLRQGSTADSGPRGPDPSANTEDGDFGARYLDEAGDGYLAIDPDEIASDPRLREPEETSDRPGLYQSDPSAGATLP